jgi:hypothetical protein
MILILFIYSCFVLLATAFSPASVKSSSSALKMSYETELGVQAPAGFFDPLGLSKKIDQTTFDFYRAAELKHGRVAQLAVLGYIIPEVYRFPGEIAPGIPFSSIPNGVAAISSVPALGWLQIFFLIGFVDYKSYTSGFPAAFPFAYGFGEKYFDTPEDKAKYESQEIAHGRLALVAILELLRHDSQNYITGVNDVLITGLPFLYPK